MLRLPHPPTMPCRALGTQCDVIVPALRCARQPARRVMPRWAGLPASPCPVVPTAVARCPARRGVAISHGTEPHCATLSRTARRCHTALYYAALHRTPLERAAPQVGAGS